MIYKRKIESLYMMELKEEHSSYASLFSLVLGYYGMDKGILNTGLKFFKNSRNQRLGEKANKLYEELNRNHKLPYQIKNTSDSSINRTFNFFLENLTNSIASDEMELVPKQYFATEYVINNFSDKNPEFENRLDRIYNNLPKSVINRIEEIKKKDKRQKRKVRLALCGICLLSNPVGVYMLYKLGELVYKAVK